MVLNLGGFKFEWHMVEGINIESEFGIGFNERILNTPAFFRASLGKSKITLDCKTLPFKKDGNSALDPLYALANDGLSYPLVSGSGKYLGRYVVVKISETRAIFTQSGAFLAQNFTLELEKTDDI